MADEIIHELNIKRIMGLQHQHPSPNIHANKINLEIYVITTCGKEYVIPAHLKKFRIYLICDYKKFNFSFDDFLIRLSQKKILFRKIIFSNVLNETRFANPTLGFSSIFRSDYQYYYESLSKKIKQNLKYYEKKLFSDTAFTFEKQEILNESAIDTYLDWKKKSHDYIWEKTTLDFINEFNITSIFTLRTSDNQYIAILLINQYDKEHAFLENLSYNQNYKNYSPGKILLLKTIEYLISQGYKSLTLGNGSSDSYKSEFATNIFTTHTGVYRKYLF